jgi:hypothetical protein
MRNQKQKRMVLDNEELIEEFFEEAKLIAIVSPVVSYKFVWHINQALSMDFAYSLENEVNVKDQYFSVYEWIDTNKLIEHYIFSNRNSKQYLLEEAKNIDFIWLIKGNARIDEIQQDVLHNLAYLQIVNHQFPLDPNQLKSKHHLIL